MSVHDIIKYVNDVFPNKAGLDKKGYQENSRETFRDETLKRWVSAAIIESKAGLAANDRNNGYRFTSAFAALIRTYGSDQWGDSLSAFMETYESYSKKLKQVKSLPKGYDVTCGNITVKLGLSAHNKLQKQILGMKLTVDEMDNLVSAGLFDKEIVPHEEYLEVNDNNQKMRTIVKLHDKYFEIRWTQYTHKDSEFPNDPVEVRKKPKIIDDWIPVEK